MQFFSPTSSSCKDKDGNLITDQQKVLKRWEESDHQNMTNDATEHLELCKSCKRNFNKFPNNARIPSFMIV